MKQIHEDFETVISDGYGWRETVIKAKRKPKMENKVKKSKRVKVKKV